jgi:hypothetical protein
MARAETAMPRRHAQARLLLPPLPPPPDAAAATPMMPTADAFFIFASHTPPMPRFHY